MKKHIFSLRQNCTNSESFSEDQNITEFFSPLKSAEHIDRLTQEDSDDKKSQKFKKNEDFSS